MSMTPTMNLRFVERIVPAPEYGEGIAKTVRVLQQQWVVTYPEKQTTEWRDIPIEVEAARPGGEHDACITATLKKAIEKCERQRMPEGSDAKPWEVDDNMVWNNGVTKCVDAIKELMPASDESNQPKEPLWPQAQTKS